MQSKEGSVAETRALGWILFTYRGHKLVLSSELPPKSDVWMSSLKSIWLFIVLWMLMYSHWSILVMQPLKNDWCFSCKCFDTYNLVLLILCCIHLLFLFKADFNSSLKFTFDLPLPGKRTSRKSPNCRKVNSTFSFGLYKCICKVLSLPMVRIYYQCHNMSCMDVSSTVENKLSH